MDEPVVLTEKLTKYYGRQRGVIDLDLEVRRGEIFGFLGPNGAGKTTTLRTLLNFIHPTRGRASILGLDNRRHSQQIRRRVGYLPGELALYESMTGEELLRYLASLRGTVDWRWVKQLSDRLKCDLKQRINSLSHGNRQKIGIIQAMMHHPELLILDEPTIGLDPLIQHEFYRLLEEIRVQGRTVLLSSHILPEVERVCDRVGIIREGRMVTVEEVSVLKAHSLRRLEIAFARPVPPAVFARVAGVEEISVENNVLRCRLAGKLDALVKAAAQFEVVDIRTQEPTLEEVFLTFYNRGEDHAA